MELSMDISIGDGPDAFSGMVVRGQSRRALKMQFAELFTITTCKNRTVQKVLMDSNWMKALVHLSTPTKLE